MITERNLFRPWHQVKNRHSKLELPSPPQNYFPCAAFFTTRMK